MAFDYANLNGRIITKFGTQFRFAQALGLSERSLSLKLNNRVQWKQTEIALAASLLDIDVEDIPRYFFTQKVQRVEL